MAGSYSKTYWEYGSAAKPSSVTVHTPTLTAGNIAAQETLRAAFEAAVDAVNLGNSGSEQFVAVDTAVAKNPSLNDAAQRELKWLVSMIDSTTGFGFNFTIPCADTSLLGTDGQFMDLAGAEAIALVTATEAFVQSRAGNYGTVSSIKLVGRTL